jgi:hypothetical protein
MIPIISAIPAIMISSRLIEGRSERVYYLLIILAMMSIKAWVFLAKIKPILKRQHIKHPTKYPELR